MNLLSIKTLKLDKFIKRLFLSSSKISGSTGPSRFPPLRSSCRAYIFKKSVNLHRQYLPKDKNPDKAKSALHIC